MYKCNEALYNCSFWWIIYRDKLLKCAGLEKENLNGIFFSSQAWLKNNYCSTTFLFTIIIKKNELICGRNGWVKINWIDPAVRLWCWWFDLFDMAELNIFGCFSRNIKIFTHQTVITILSYANLNIHSLLDRLRQIIR